jgi:hypothetical protein
MCDVLTCDVLTCDVRRPHVRRATSSRQTYKGLRYGYAFGVLACSHESGGGYHRVSGQHVAPAFARCASARQASTGQHVARLHVARLHVARRTSHVRTWCVDVYPRF